MTNEKEISSEVSEASPDSNEQEHEAGEGNSRPSPSSSNKAELAASDGGGNSGGRRRRLLMLVGGILLIIAAVLAITLPLTIGDDSDSDSSPNSSTATVGQTLPIGADEERQRAFSQKLPLFGQDILDGYQNEEDLQAALAVALEREASAFIAQENKYFKQSYNFMEESHAAEDGDMMARPETSQSSMAESDMAMTGGSLAAGSTADVTDFQTNNQEENVDEADSIKADENFVYASYGDHILIWNTEGKQVGSVTMPPIELPEKNEDAIIDPVVETPPLVSSTTARTSFIGPEYYNPKPYIQSMLLTDNHLIALVSGYGDYAYYGWAMPEEQGDEQRETPILQQYKASQIRLYEKTDTGALNFIGKKDVNGNFIDARSIGNVVHLATVSTVDTWNNLWSPLSRYNFDKNMTQEEYLEEAMTLATEKLIPTLTRKLTEELQLDNGELPTMMQINQWMTTPDDAETPSFSIPFGQYDVVSNIAQVTSFDATAPLINEELDTSASTYLAPAWFDTLYGTEDRLVLATSGWDWDATEGESTQKTYLVALKINGASTEFLSVGTLDGHLLNSYALDILGDELRAATTVERNRWWWGRPMPMVDDMMAVDVAVSVRPAQANDVEAVSEILTAEVDPNGLCPLPENDDCVNDKNYQECLVLVRDGCVSVEIAESCPLQFSCSIYELKDEDVPPTIFETRPPEPEEEESRTENYMIVMNLGTEGKMSERGRAQIGLKNERITSVRFFDDVAYAVTFERTDPFYVLDMSVPKVLGELKLPGFSSYLHSMNADNTQLVAVGQNATNDGRVTGLMVTVFDATDPAKPQVLQSHTFENSENAYSSSNVEWDFKAFRYVAGKLIIPMSIYYQQEWNQAIQQFEPLPEGLENFNGFSVLDVNANEITEQFRVSHAREVGSCSCGGYLPTRSFVYSGDLMTVQDSVVVSTNLDTGAEVWRLPVVVEGEESNNCCWEL